MKAMFGMRKLDLAALRLTAIGEPLDEPEVGRNQPPILLLFRVVVD